MVVLHDASPASLEADMIQDDASSMSRLWVPQAEAAILAFAGSSRRGSLNQKLLDVAISSAISLGAEVSVIDLRDLELPIYDQDLEAEGMPQNVMVFRQILAAHDGLLIASPEYNGSLAPLLKNALDWSSRPTSGIDGIDPYRGKIASIMSASMGPFGGLRSLSHLRGVLSKMGVLVLPEELALPLAHMAFERDALREERVHLALERQVAQFVGALRLTQDHLSGAEDPVASS
jgi:NAD(P)H-dependent FMN reductase